MRESTHHQRLHADGCPLGTTLPIDEAAVAQFGKWLDGELETLVARWQHLAAPRALVVAARGQRSRILGAMFPS